jgi:hypothetical protein
VLGSGTEKSDLVAIMPHVREDMCKRIYKKSFSGSEIPILNVIPNLTSHPQEVAENELVILPAQNGCIKTPNGYYYYNVLFER